MQKDFELVERSVEILLDDAAGYRHGYSYEDIAFAIFPLVGFEESREDFYLFGIGCCPNGFFYISGGVHGRFCLGQR